MSLSRRDRRLGVYGYSSRVLNGIAADRWTLAGTYWGRADDYRGRQPLVGSLPDARVDAVVQLALEAVVPANAIIVDGTALLTAGVLIDGTPGVYHVQYVTAKRAARVQLAYAVRVSLAWAQLVPLVLDGSFLLDGSDVLGGVLT